jgi:hypothetical protein
MLVLEPVALLGQLLQSVASRAQVQSKLQACSEVLKKGLLLVLPLMGMETCKEETYQALT